MSLKINKGQQDMEKVTMDDSGVADTTHVYYYTLVRDAYTNEEHRAQRQKRLRAEDCTRAGIFIQGSYK